MEFFPIFLDIKSKPCLVVGGGSVAARKVSLLRKAKGQVIVVSPHLCEEMQAWADKGEIEYLAREFEPADLDAKVMVIAATNVAAVNQQISELATVRSLPVNVVDQPELCSFITPSMIDREPYRSPYPPVVPRRYWRVSYAPSWKAVFLVTMAAWLPSLKSIVTW